MLSRWKSWRNLWLLLIIAFSGCRGPESYLPEPRLPDDEEEEVRADPPPATTVSAPAAIKAPSTATVPQPSVATPTAAAPSASSQPVASPTNTKEGSNIASPANELTPLPVSKRDEMGNVAAASNSASAEPSKGVNPSRQRAIESLRAISAALSKYREKNKRLPDRYFHIDDQPFLSWRVELLPYLGYGELYKKFNYRESWDSPANRPLLAQIPPVYASPERTDDRTNFVLAVGPGTSYHDYSGPRDDHFTDGMANTVLLIETSNERAVPWTKPEDWEVRLSSPTDQLFDLREDGLFAIMGDLAVRQIPSSIDIHELNAMLTVRGNEPVHLLEWTRDPSNLVDEQLARTHRASRSNSPDVQSTSIPDNLAAPTPKPAAAVGHLTAPPEPDLAPSETAQKPPVPSQADLKAAENLIKQVYGTRYSKAKSVSERREIATSMLSEAETLRHELPSYFAMLRIARDIATSQGDLQSALEAMNRIEQTFAANPIEICLPWIETAVKHAQSASDAELLFERTGRLLDEALAMDAFNACREIQTLYGALAKKSSNASHALAVTRARERHDDARKAYHQVAEHLHALLREPNHPEANHEVGKYLCFSKGNWDKGLTHLAMGTDGPLKQVAILDLQRPTTPDAQAILGDSYWTISDSGLTAEQGALRGRAVYWYRLALPLQPNGLRKTLIQERLKVAEESASQRRTHASF